MAPSPVALLDNLASSGGMAVEGTGPAAEAPVDLATAPAQIHPRDQGMQPLPLPKPQDPPQGRPQAEEQASNESEARASSSNSEIGRPAKQQKKQPQVNPEGLVGSGPT
jgi:hypothetical protein